MTAAGWHPDPAGAPGRLRWWDGQAWTEHVHEQAAATASVPAADSPLDAAVLVVGPARVATPGTRVFELEDADGGRLGRMVETARGVNDSAFGAALSRSKGWQHATTRELRGPRGYPELVLTWGPAEREAQGSSARLIFATLPDRREVGRLVHAPELVGGETSWAIFGPDGGPVGTATSGGSNGVDGRRLSQVVPGGGGGWQVRVEGGPHQEPLRSLVVAAAAVADVL